jgi:hypothetical protein
MTTAFDVNNVASVTAAIQPLVISPVQPPKVSFKQIAAPMIDRNIPLIPLRPRTKIAFQNNWQELASTDPKQIAEWGEQFPDANLACVAKAALGGFWFFEIDEPNYHQTIQKETGKQFPNTFTVTSRKGEGRGHFYFKQTPSSMAMGNLQGKIDGKEAWSARVDNRYVVGLGSIHPDTQKPYTVAVDVPIVEAPDWLIEWCLKNASGQSERVNASPDGPSIPHGSHDTELFRIACMLRNAGMDYEQIRDNLVTICEKRCTGYGSDYEQMCANKAKSACKYPVGHASPVAILGGGAADPSASADVSNWRSQFRNLSEMEEGEIVMVIDGVLQEGTCFIGATAGHGKTLVALAFAKAICLGEPLFGLPEYPVMKPRNVIYLIPESGDRAFRKRGEAFRLPADDRFIARTISSGVSLQLSDPSLLEAVRQRAPVVILDTASRFLRSKDENSAAENRSLVNDVIELRAAGAVAVIILHHAKKSTTEKREAMTLENMLRGTSDFGAMCDQAYGIRRDDHLYNHGAGPTEIEIVNLKDRERLGGLTSLTLAASYKKQGAICPTSVIDETGNFRLVDFKATKDRDRETLIQLVQANPMMSITELSAAAGMKPFTVRETLTRLGWHVAKGGSDGHSPWHKDEGKPCPFASTKAPKSVDLDAPIRLKRAA